jgi:Amt family ammonium transporter
VSAQEAAPEIKKEEPAAAATEAPKTDEPKAEEKKEEAAPVVAGDPTPPLTEVSYAVDNITLFLAAVLVIFMQAGFALVETGLNSSKNAVNIMFKNYMDFIIGSLLFFIIGFGMMYPGSSNLGADKKVVIIPGWLEYGGLGVPSPELGKSTLPTASAQHPMTPQGFFLFQVAFCATAATIVSGSVAGRIKFSAYLIYTAVISGVIYPISGMWMWGGGWLYTMGLKDFAGSLVVHTVGGMAGLAGAIALGPRLGRYVNGKPVAMPGHNIPYACLGVFILIIGWYGFNPGSQLAFTGTVNVDTIALVAVNTTLACCTGSFAAMMFSWIVFKKPDLTFALNGGLCGLVGITANCNVVTNNSALAIGAIAGVLVCLAILALDKLQIDDPVGAFPVHGVGGMWGGIATGLFFNPELMGTAMLPGAGPASLTTQLVGTFVIAGWALGGSLIMFFALKAFGLLRVHAEEEIAGLDISEHGMYAYPQNVVALDSVNSSFGTSYTKPAGHGALAHKPSTEAS